MSCFYPRPAWRETQPNESGNYAITFKKTGSQLDPDLEIPCGKCTGCASDKALEWSIRIYHEAQLHDQNCFITLTYDDNCLPADNKINKRDVQLFLKRLRKHLKPHKIRYFLTGEYGSQTKRPHYHAIIFGNDFLGGSYPINNELYGNPILDAIWNMGLCSIGSASINSSMYVAGYVNKKIDDKDTFSLMSKQPPIGREWLRKYLPQCAATGTCIITGKEYPLPKTYFKWEPLELDYVNAMRQSKANPRTLEQLRNKEKNHNARLNLKAEKL